MAKKKKSPKAENIEINTEVNTEENLQEIDLKDLESLEIYTEEAAFLSDIDKNELESLFEPKAQEQGVFSAAENEDVEADIEDEDVVAAISELGEAQENDEEDEDTAEFAEGSEDEELVAAEDLEGSELDDYEPVNIEDIEFVEDERTESIIESILFATDKPVSLNAIKLVFKGTNVKGDKIKRILDKLAIDYASGNRGVYLDEVPGGYQLRTKIDNMNFLKRTLKVRPFKLSGPALEVLAIVAYKQPLIKHEIDEIRGVESGHLLRALMEKGIVTFAGKSDLPGKPMQYVTTKKFLEIFGLRNLKELPTLSQIDELLPEGIHEDDDIKNTKLSSITDSMSQNVGDGSYSEGEEELNKLSEQLDEISTSSDFFEQEKQRQKEKKEFEKAQNIREALEMGESVPTRDKNWLMRYDEAIAAGKKSIDEVEKPKAKVAAATDNDASNSTEEEQQAQQTEDSQEEVTQEDHFEMEMTEEESESIDFEEKEEELPYVATDEEFEGNP
jgi:segregation and condensation protein B